MPIPFDWDHVYLLGWYDNTGRSHLTSWMGHAPYIEAIVTGHGPYGPPLWTAQVPEPCQLHPIPEGVTTKEAKIACATGLGGVFAFGWHFETPIQRVLPNA